VTKTRYGAMKIQQKGCNVKKTNNNNNGDNVFSVKYEMKFQIILI